MVTQPGKYIIGTQYPNPSLEMVLVPRQGKTSENFEQKCIVVASIPILYLIVSLRYYKDFIVFSLFFGFRSFGRKLDCTDVLMADLHIRSHLYSCKNNRFSHHLSIPALRLVGGGEYSASRRSSTNQKARSRPVTYTDRIETSGK